MSLSPRPHLSCGTEADAGRRQSSSRHAPAIRGQLVMPCLRDLPNRPPASSRMRACSRLAAAGIGFGLAAILQPAASAEQLPRSVLFLDQFEVASPFSAAIYAKFRSTLDAQAPQPVSTYVENLDLGRFGRPQFEAALEAFFREKYRDKPVAVVVALGSAALGLTMHLRAALWPDSPIIFAAVDEHALDGVELPTNVTGTTTRLNLADSVSVARALVPGLKRIAIVGDPPERQ